MFFDYGAKKMIVLKSREDVETMKDSCKLAASVLDHIEEKIAPGISTEEINTICHNLILDHGATPSPLNYRGFPKSVCTSINEVVCHGIPNEKVVLKEGDIINVDVTAYLNSFHGDTSRTFMVGKCSRAARELVDKTYESLWIGINAAKPGGRIGDIGAAIQEYVEAEGYSVVREYCGHGIGRNFHEDPHVTHYGKRGTGELIRPGMVFTIEPMINQGKANIEILDDDWTVVTQDRKLSAQFEHTVAIWEDKIEIMTLAHNEDRPNEISW